MQFIRASGKAVSVMALANRLGTMEQSTPVNGEKIEHMEKAASYM